MLSSRLFFRNILLDMLFRNLFAVLAAFFLCLAITAQKVVVNARLDSTTIRVGEQVRLRTGVKSPAGADVLFPDFSRQKLDTAIEVLEMSEIDTLLSEDGKSWELQRSYLLTAFDSVACQIPRLLFEINGSKYFSDKELSLKVESVPVNAERPDLIRPFHTPVSAVFKWTSHLLLWCVALWLCGGMLLCVGITLFSRKTFTRKIKAVPSLPPHQTALDALEKLRLKGERVGKGQKNYFMELSDVLRTYLYKRFSFNAKEMTTHEIIETLKDKKETLSLSELHFVLDMADLVKFARHEVSLLESDRALFQAASYVQTTRVEVEVDAEPQNTIVPIEETKQTRLRLLLVVSAIFLFAVSLSVFAYIVYMLWLYFR